MIKEIDGAIIKDFEIISKDSPFVKFYGYYINNLLVGLLEFNHMYDKIEIANIFVKEDYRKQRIASKLIAKLIKYAKINDCVNITLEVNINNKVAISLYEKFGFCIVAKRSGYYEGIDALLMELVL